MNNTCPIVSYKRNPTMKHCQIIHFQPDNIGLDNSGRGRLFCGKTGWAKRSRFTSCWGKVTCKKCIKKVLSANWDKIKVALSPLEQFKESE